MAREIPRLTNFLKDIGVLKRFREVYKTTPQLQIPSELFKYIDEVVRNDIYFHLRCNGASQNVQNRWKSALEFQEKPIDLTMIFDMLYQDMKNLSDKKRESDILELLVGVRCEWKDPFDTRPIIQYRHDIGEVLTGHHQELRQEGRRQEEVVWVSRIVESWKHCNSTLLRGIADDYQLTKERRQREENPLVEWLVFVGTWAEGLRADASRTSKYLVYNGVEKVGEPGLVRGDRAGRKVRKRFKGR